MNNPFKTSKGLETGVSGTKLGHSKGQRYPSYHHERDKTGITDNFHSTKNSMKDIRNKCLYTLSAHKLAFAKC